VWVQLAALVPRRNVDERQIADSRYLHVVRGLDEVRAGDGTIGDKTSAVTRLDTPGNLNAFCIAYNGFGARLRRREDAEVVYGIDWKSLRL
jgi:hypothetical protein